MNFQLRYLQLFLLLRNYLVACAVCCRGRCCYASVVAKCTHTHTHKINTQVENDAAWMSSNSLYANNQRISTLYRNSALSEQPDWFMYARSCSHRCIHFCVHTWTNQMQKFTNWNAKKLNLLDFVNFSLFHCINLNVFFFFFSVPWYDVNFWSISERLFAFHFAAFNFKHIYSHYFIYSNEM